MRLGFFSTEYFRKRPGMAESDRELCQELARIGDDVRAVVEDRRLAPGEVTVDRDGAVRLWRYQAPKFCVLRPRTYADKVLKRVFGDPRVASLLAIYGRFPRENGDLI